MPQEPGLQASLFISRAGVKEQGGASGLDGSYMQPAQASVHKAIYSLALTGIVAIALALALINDQSVPIILNI